MRQWTTCVIAMVLWWGAGGRGEVWAGTGQGAEKSRQQRLLRLRQQKQAALRRRRIWLRTRLQPGWYLKKPWRYRYYDEILKGCGARCRGRLYAMKRSQIDRLLQHLQKSYAHVERLRILSAMFLGGLYRLGPLGEGPKGKYDRDPVFRLDRVDCVTFVETVMAFAMSHSVKQAIAVLQKIRYKDGIIRYSHRNHFTATQWLVHNERAGYIRSITEQLGGRLTRYVDRQISRETWKGTLWQKRIPFAFLPQSYRFAYIPLHLIPQIMQKLPPLAWVGEVKDKPGDPVAVQHVGFLVRKGNRIMFRDANIMPGVSDRSLLSYVKWRMRQVHEPDRKYVIVGFAFATFTDVDKK